jgi:N-acetylmannosamine-6-phosphate 2-epimerase / N-acetylmannosamine kinase
MTGRAAPLRLALDLGGTKTSAALVWGDRVLERRVAPTPAQGGPEAVVENAAGLLAPFLDRADAVCVAATGHVRGGTVSAVNRATMPGWDAFPLAAALAARCGRPVRLVNDAHAAAWGEARFGAGRGARDFAFVTVSTGVGGGLVLGGRLLLGVRGLAGHLGFWRGASPAAGDPVLEDVASGSAIARAGSAALGRPLSTREVFAAAEAGDPAADAVVEAAFDRLAAALVDLRWLVDPARVAIGGSVGLAPGYLARLRDALALREPEDPLSVVAAELRCDAGLLGAADLLGGDGTTDDGLDAAADDGAADAAVDDAADAAVDDAPDAEPDP